MSIVCLPRARDILPSPLLLQIIAFFAFALLHFVREIYHLCISISYGMAAKKRRKEGTMADRSLLHRLPEKSWKILGKRKATKRIGNTIAILTIHDHRGQAGRKQGRKNRRAGDRGWIVRGKQAVKLPFKY